LVIALESGPTHLDPRYATDASSARISALIFNSLARPDENLRLQPELAETWQAADERTYLVRLRQGVAFHDGRPLTATDVKYTYESVLRPDSRSPKRGALRFLKAVDQLGPYELRFRLWSPFAPFLESLTLGIVPHGAAANPSAGSRALIGSGPFSWVEFAPGERVVLKANPSYWEGMPRLSGVVFKIVPDAIVRALEFRKGTIDLIQNDLEPDMLPWLRHNTEAAVDVQDGTIFQYIGMNLEHPILKRREARQAVARAIDRNAIIRHLMKDLAIPATGLLSPRHWAYEASVPQFGYSPDEAKRLLDRAGLPDPDGDGPLPRFKLSYKTTNIDLRKRIAETLKEQLARVGIELEVRTYEWGTFYGDIQKGNFHLYSLEWVGVADPDIYYNLFHSSSIPPHGNNRGRYRNAEVDQLLERARQSLRLEERRRIYGKVQRLLAVDLPYIPMWWKKNVVVMKPTVQGFALYPDGDFISLKRAFIADRPSP
jgi:peptide/nickel transport system substrate-binding protein